MDNSLKTTVHGNDKFQCLVCFAWMCIFVLAWETTHCPNNKFVIQLFNKTTKNKYASVLPHKMTGCSLSQRDQQEKNIVHKPNPFHYVLIKP